MLTPRLKALIRPWLPRSVRPRRILAGPLRGAWLVTSWQHYPSGLLGRTETHLLDWFSTHVRLGETWLDVGAYCGYTAIALARLVGPTGRVFAFEPSLEAAECADRTRTLNELSQVRVLPVGLGVPPMFEMRNGRLYRGMAEAVEPEASADQPIAMPVVRFDWLWPLVHGGNPAIHGIKIDVQGMEVEVLEGMTEVLRRARPKLVIELHEGVDRGRFCRAVEAAQYGPGQAVDPTVGNGAFANNFSYAFDPTCEPSQQQEGTTTTAVGRSPA